MTIHIDEESGEDTLVSLDDMADWEEFALANREALELAEPGEAVAFINADMVCSREIFAASERRFAEGKRLIMMAASRTLGGERGVLTDRDVARIDRSLPGLFDTVAIRDAKLGSTDTSFVITCTTTPASVTGFGACASRHSRASVSHSPGIAVEGKS